MEKIYDTTKMEQCGKDILNLIDLLEKKYDYIFERIKKMPIETSEWVGPAAQRYTTSVLIEKKEFDNYTNDLKCYANYLIDFATEIDSKKERLRK